MVNEKTCAAFAGPKLIAAGGVSKVVLGMKKAIDQGERENILVLDDETGRQVDFDLRGTPEETLARLQHHPFYGTTRDEGESREKRGRPKLGVVAREVTLLPRHWDWLETHPSGISAALRNLVEGAMKSQPKASRAMAARDAVGKVMWVLGGNLPGFEEASRALYAGQWDRFADLIRPWPKDIRNYLSRLAKGAVRP
jgi:hypothetical protein